MSTSSDLGSDEDPSAANTPVHDRKSIKRAAVADESGKLTAGGAYGATMTAAAAVVAAETDEAVVAAGSGNGGLDSNESAKLLGKRGTADGGVSGGGGVDGEDGEYDSGADVPGDGTKNGGAGTGGGGGAGGLGAITPPLGFCLFGYFVNKLITEVLL